jgi:hypothetical protein
MRLRTICAALLALAVPSMALAANVAGAWNLQLVTDQGNLPVSCTLTQTENAIGGTCGGGMSAPSPTTGAVTGDDVTFNYDVDFGGTPLHVVFTGHVAADGALAGNFAAGPPGGAANYNGTFSGAKAPAATPAAPAG